VALLILPHLANHETIVLIKENIYPLLKDPHYMAKVLNTRARNKDTIKATLPRISLLYSTIL